jgi:large subunit ribosomal protein L24
MNIRKGDTVYVRTGQDAGKTGRVLFVNQNSDKLVVEGINMKKKHQKPSQKSPKGGIVTIEGPIHISNVAIYSSSLSGPTKISSRVIKDGGKDVKVRICKKTGEQI